MRARGSECCAVLNNDVGEGRVFGWVDFGQREDQERNCDRDNAGAEENDPFDTCLSFMCHLLAQPFSDQLPPLAMGSTGVRESVR
jgi:hypothetical protein